MTVRFAVDVDYGDYPPKSQRDNLLVAFNRPTDREMGVRVRKLGKMTKSTPTSVVRQMILHCLDQAGV